MLGEVAERGHGREVEHGIRAHGAVEVRSGRREARERAVVNDAAGVPVHGARPLSLTARRARETTSGVSAGLAAHVTNPAVVLRGTASRVYCVVRPVRGAPGVRRSLGVRGHSGRRI